MNKVWQYISVSLSLDELKDASELGENIKQNILPIKYLELSQEQQLFYDLIESRTRNGRVASEMIDDPTREPIEKLTKGVTKVQHAASFNLLAIPLKPIAFRETPKYQELLKFINSVDLNEKLLIYANEDHLMQQLKAALTDDGYKVAYVENNRNDIEDYIKKLYQDVDIVIINPKFISVGIDISNVENLVWYQLLNSITDILQAQRRISRLSSKNLSNVKFLAYDRTSQRKMLDEISENNKNNAAAYGYQDDSELSKLTGILLGNIK